MAVNISKINITVTPATLSAKQIDLSVLETTTQLSVLNAIANELALALDAIYGNGVANVSTSLEAAGVHTPLQSIEISGGHEFYAVADDLDELLDEALDNYANGELDDQIS